MYSAYDTLYSVKEREIMKKVITRFCSFLVAVCCLFGSVFTTPIFAADTVDVHRLYNPNTGEHFYTISEYESNHLRSLGWKYEGIGWVGSTAGDPVYRVYNPNADGGDHYYTVSQGEASYLVSLGWRWDNDGKPAFYSGGDCDLYVEYNPNARSGAHNYTTSQAEHEHLLSVGWIYGAVAWQVVAPGTPYTPETYVVNKKSKIFHHPECQAVKKMSASNKLVTKDDRFLLIAHGYRPCQDCNP